MAIFLKDPAARLDYAIDWQAFYLDGQTVLQSQWRVSPDAADGIMPIDAGHDGGRTAVTLTGGRRGILYRVTNQVTLSGGRCDERSLAVRAEDR